MYNIDVKNLIFELKELTLMFNAFEMYSNSEIRQGVMYFGVDQVRILLSLVKCCLNSTEEGNDVIKQQLSTCTFICLSWIERVELNSIQNHHKYMVRTYSGLQTTCLEAPEMQSSTLKQSCNPDCALF